MKCAVKDCTNHTHEGKFIGLLCAPCHAFIAGDGGGNWSQVCRNTHHEIDEAVRAEREACAKVCEDDVRTWSHPGSITRAECAAAIRARGQEPPR